MLRRGDHGDEVRALQTALVQLGYALPRWGVDGDLGSETLDALAGFLRAHGALVDDDANAVSDAELALVQRTAAAIAAAPIGPRLDSGRFNDLRAAASQERVGGRRAWTDITGITLHQTACMLGERPQRWQSVAAHLGVTRGGQVMWMHELEQVVWHGNGLNASTIGIEMDGEYAGIEGDDRTFWRPADEPGRTPQAPTDALVQATIATVVWLCDEVKRHGGRVAHLYAHRQASNTRESDPGSALWQRVALVLLSRADLALDDGGPGYKVGSGLPIPVEWDPRRVGYTYRA